MQRNSVKIASIFLVLFFLVCSSRYEASIQFVHQEKDAYVILLHGLGQSKRSMKEIKARVQSLINELEEKGALVYIPRSYKDYTVKVGLRMLILRHLVQEENDQFRVASGEINLLQYYVNAIAHHI